MIHEDVRCNHNGGHVFVYLVHIHRVLIRIRFHFCPELGHNRQHKTVRDWEALQDTSSQKFTEYPQRAFDMESENHPWSRDDIQTVDIQLYNHY